MRINHCCIYISRIYLELNLIVPEGSGSLSARKAFQRTLFFYIVAEINPDGSGLNRHRGLNLYRPRGLGVPLRKKSVLINAFFF